MDSAGKCPTINCPGGGWAQLELELTDALVLCEVGYKSGHAPSPKKYVARGFLKLQNGSVLQIHALGKVSCKLVVSVL